MNSKDDSETSHQGGERKRTASAFSVDRRTLLRGGVSAAAVVSFLSRDAKRAGNVGTNAAVANAVYHATGKRICALPIRIKDFFV